MGLPEARLNLAEAAIYLARAPKSNSVVHGARNAAMEDAASADPVPTHLRDASYPGARKLGHGEGYRYPHDFPGHRSSRSTARPGSQRTPVLRALGMGREEDWTTAPSRPAPPGMLRDPPTTKESPPMIATGGDVALIILASAWAVLVAGLSTSS